MDNLKLDIFFSNLKSTLGPSYFDFITEMDIKPYQLYSNISLSQINRLTNRLNVTIDSIFQDKVDFEVLRNQYQGKANLPSRYQGAEFSSRFTSMYMVNFITKNFGSDAAKFIKQRFQQNG